MTGSRWRGRAWLPLLLCALLVVGVASPAAAHEERRVGRYMLAVGFGSEPAYAGQQNSVQLYLHDARTGKPITDLGPTLRVIVSYGKRKMAPLTMEPDFEVGEFGTPGDYRAWFFPTRPGRYTFHFLGNIHGQKVNESFTSGPHTFSNIEDPTTVEFPVRDPTVGQLAQRVAVVTQHNARQASAAASGADRALWIAVAALVVAIAALVAGMWRLRRA